MGKEQERIVEAVLDGSIDVGFTRSDLLSVMQEEGRALVSDFKFIDSVERTFHGTRFPYPVSGSVYPQWPVSSVEVCAQPSCLC